MVPDRGRHAQHRLAIVVLPHPTRRPGPSCARTSENDTPSTACTPCLGSRRSAPMSPRESDSGHEVPDTEKRRLRALRRPAVPLCQLPASTRYALRLAGRRRRSRGRQPCFGAQRPQPRPLSLAALDDAVAARRKGQPVIAYQPRGAPGIETTSSSAYRSGVPDEQARVRVRRLQEQGLHGGLFDDLTGVHDRPRLTPGHYGQVVGDEYQREPEVLRQAEQQLENLACTITSGPSSLVARESRTTRQAWRAWRAVASLRRTRAGSDRRGRRNATVCSRSPTSFLAPPRRHTVKLERFDDLVPTRLTGSERSSRPGTPWRCPSSVQAHRLLAAAQDVLPVQQDLPDTLALDGSSP